MSFLIASGAGANVALIGQQLALSVGTPTVSVAGAANVNLTGQAITLGLGLPSVSVPSGTNAWDLPTPDVTVTITSPFTAAKLHTAISSVLADGQQYEIVCPTATTLAATGTAISTSYDISGMKMTIKFNGCGLDMSAAGARTLQFKAAYLRRGDRVGVGTTTIGATTYTLLNFIDLSAGTVASEYPIGTVLKVYSNARYYGDITAARRQGEEMIVLAQSGTTVTLYCPLITGGTQTLLNYQFPTTDQGGGTPYGAANDPRVAKLDTTARLWIDKLRLVRTQTNTGDLFTLRRLYSPIINRPNVTQFADAAFKILGCFGGYFTDPNPVQDGAAGSPNGYGFQILGKNNQIRRTTSSSSCSMSTCRHTFDGTGNSPGATTAAATDDQVTIFGGAFNNMMYAVPITAMKSSAIAQHSQSDYCKVVGCSYSGATSLSLYYRTVRGKNQIMDGIDPFSGTRTVVRAGRILQLYTYCADPASGGGSLTPDGYWGDGCNAQISGYDFHCVSGGGSMIDCSPSGFRYMRITGTAFSSIVWYPENSSARCNHSGRGAWTSAGNFLIYGSVFTDSFYTLTKPSVTTDAYGSGDPYSAFGSTWAFTDEDIDLAALSTVGAHTLTIWNVGAGCTVTGNATIRNKPANITLAGGNGKAGTGSHSGLTVTIV